MVDHITNVIDEYQAKVSQMPFVPKSSFQRDLLGRSGYANNIFLAFLFTDYATGLQFLNDVWILRRKVLTNRCGRDVSCRCNRC
jgi:hypothetical protein